MSKDYQNATFKQLLDKLQQESWQLELLISGFAIFGLFSATEPIGIKLEIAKHNQHLAETLIWFAAQICCWILISNLLIHVILRGLWIGALGLRYVSGDIDYDVLKYSSKFTKYLQRKIGSFDKYIATLEDYCSVLFAVSFLFVFYFLASFAFVVFLLIVTLVFLDNDASGSIAKILEITGITLIIFTLIGMFLTFVDFITQGFLKRKKWTTFFYFPVYRVFSIITLSFLYRPLVYNLLDNKFGKKLSFILVPVYVVILYLFTHSYTISNYIGLERNSSNYYANPSNYEDLIINENDFIKTAIIPSKVITDSYLKVFMVFNDRIEDRLFKFNPDLKPNEDRRGLHSEVVFFGEFNAEDFRKKDSLRLVYFKTFNQIHKITIDNKKFESKFIAGTTKNKRLGFETYLNIDSLTEGKHLLKISRRYINKKKDTVSRALVKIPFWKYNKN